MTRKQWEALEEKARIHGFFASGIVQAGLLKDLHRAIERASSKGTTLEQFKAEVGPKMIQEWAGTVANPSARLENIFRTNLQRAYAHGRRAQQLEPVVLKVRPYWTLVPVLDKRTSEICQDIARRNVVLPATHVFWKTHVPPLHFQCRTAIRALRLEEAERLGITTRPPKVEPMQGFGGVQEIKADTKGLPLKLAEQVKARNKKPPPPPPKPPVELKPPKPPPPQVTQPVAEPRMATRIKGAVAERVAKLYPNLNRIWGGRLHVEHEDAIPLVAPLAKLPEPLMVKLSSKLDRIDAGKGGVGDIDSIAFGPPHKTVDGREWSTVAGVFARKRREGSIVKSGRVIVGTVEHGCMEVINHEIGHAVDLLLTHSSAEGTAFRTAWDEWRKGEKLESGEYRKTLFHLDYMTNDEYGFKEAFADAFDRYHSRGRETAVAVYGETMVAAMEADLARVQTEDR